MHSHKLGPNSTLAVSRFKVFHREIHLSITGPVGCVVVDRPGWGGGRTVWANYTLDLGLRAWSKRPPGPTFSHPPLPSPYALSVIVIWHSVIRIAKGELFVPVFLARSREIEINVSSFCFKILYVHLEEI